MKVILFKYSIQLVYFLSAAVLVLLAAAFLLYQEKATVQSRNRVLILQNDSILSENIKLKDIILEQQVQYSDKQNGLSSLKLP